MVKCLDWMADLPVNVAAPELTSDLLFTPNSDSLQQQANVRHTKFLDRKLNCCRNMCYESLKHLVVSDSLRDGCVLVETQAAS